MKTRSWNEIGRESVFIKKSLCKRLEQRLQQRFIKTKTPSKIEPNTLKELGELKHERFRRLVNNLSYDQTYLRLAPGEKRIFLGYFISKYSLFETYEEWIEVTLQAIENEAWFHTQYQFWEIPYHFFNQWFDQIINRQVPFHESYSLMAVLIVLCKYKNMPSKNSSPPFIRLCSDITGFDKKMVAKSIQSLDRINILDCKRHKKFDRIQIKIPSWLKWEAQTAEEQPDYVSIKRWKERLVDLKCYDELLWIEYLYALPFSDYNPFISCIYPNLIIHQAMLNANILLFSIFNENQIQDLHRIWVKRQFTRSINSRYEKAKAHIARQLKQTKVLLLTTHYKQIRKCWPILNFISKRKRYVDQKVLWDSIYIQHALLLITENQLKELIKGQKFDSKYFWQCLRSDNFKEEWEKKYKIGELDPFFDVYNENQDQLGEILQLGIREMYHDPIQRFQQAKKCYQELRHVLGFLNKNHLNSLVSEFRCLDNKTHRITFSKYPIQNIPKDIRSIVRAPPGKLFLLVDISSAELAILKWFVIKYQGLARDALDDLTFENIAFTLKLNRAIIKALIFPFLYGAAVKTMCNKSDQSKDVVRSFRKTILDFPGVKAFRELAIEYAKNNRLSLATPLGHQFPIFGDPHTQGLSHLIQGTCAELLREWILELSKLGIAPEISSIIHDEIILEVDEEKIFKRIIQVKTCLNKAQETILPGMEIHATICTSNSWDEKSGFSFTDKFSYVP